MVEYLDLMVKKEMLLNKLARNTDPHLKQDRTSNKTSKYLAKVLAPISKGKLINLTNIMKDQALSTVIKSRIVSN